MASLINSIPVQKPQTQGTVRPAQPNHLSNLPTAAVSNPFPQVQTYSYLPAKPLSPGNTRPKGVRPHKASGHIVKENIFESAASTVKSYANYAKYFYNAAFKGEGTDYSVGKINDLAIRTGSLGIAAVLASSKFFPFAKGMEFIGLGTWFASMAVWPQIIGAAIKAKTGVDINQKYIDSYGRRKFVYEDNLYRPMDLFRHVDEKGRPLSEEEYYQKYKDDYAYLSATADKLGIPKNIHNRNEAAMNKMGQIAVQGKTIWMLTAGVMTPVISSIVADALQTPLKNGIEKHRYNKELKELEKIDDALYELADLQSPFDSRKIETNIDTVIEKLGIKIPQLPEQELNSLIIKDCELTKSEFDRLKKISEENLAGTQLKTALDNALNNAVINGEKVTLPKANMPEVLTALQSLNGSNVSGQIKDELEHNLTRAQKLDKKEFERLQKFIDDRYAGTGFKDAFDRLVKYEMRYTEPHITLSDNLRDGLSQTVKKAIKEAVANMDPEFAATLPDAVTNYQGVTQEEFSKIISRSFNDGAKEMNLIANNSFENIAKRVIAERFANINLDEDAVDMIAESINKHIKKFMNSQRHFIIPQQRMKDLFRFIEANKEIISRIEKFEAASIMNISESITANNWNKIPQEYLKLLKFTNEEIAQIAALDSSSASRVISQKYEQIAADPKQYEEVIKKMTKYAQKAIEKEAKAAEKLIGTAETSATLSNLKDLMSAVGGSNFGDNIGNPVSEFYRTTIFDVQNKLRNTIDSLVRPIKGLDTFRNIDKIVKDILGYTAQEYSDRVYGHIDRNIKLNPNYHMFEGLSYEQATESLKAYIKDIVLDKNDINNWTTKFEHNIPGVKRGLKYSLEIVKKIADAVNGDMSAETEEIIKNAFLKNAQESIENINSEADFAKRALGEEFAKLCNQNNAIMRFRYLALENKLTRDFLKDERPNYMRDYTPAAKIIDEICTGNNKNLHVLEALLNERKTEIPLDGIAVVKKIIQKGKGMDVDLTLKEIESAKTWYLNFATSNKAISEMSGKNVTEFFKNAAENVRSRNKWSKLAYGLLAGTTALTALAVALVGKKNYFNKDIYEYKNPQQGAGQ